MTYEEIVESVKTAADTGKKFRSVRGGRQREPIGHFIHLINHRRKNHGAAACGYI